MPQPGEEPSTSLVLVHPGPKWDHTQPLAKQHNADGHMAWVARHVASGTAIAAGPIWRHDEHLDGDLVGVIILDVTATEAKRLTSTDPAVTGGQLAVDVHPFHRVTVAPQ
ncbi:hypothetical protein ABZ671_30715 [Micromonospora sp. NPDC006766]|uniref:YciI family protein n=1 Tax=Micromonospora sp. NPDC006766 TaxID=3154778 RepID=UPI0033CA134F